MTVRLVAGLVFALLCASSSFAQVSPDALVKAQQELEQYRQNRAPILRNDFGELARYRDADVKLGPASRGEARVVFMGDSITDGWNLAKYFPGRLYINRGIGGQTTPQMLLRFREDVVALTPKAVIILAGTNDIAGNTGPMTLQEIESNLASMADLARANGIAVLVSSVTPVNDYTAQAMKFFPLRPAQEIVDLNRWIKDYCLKGSCIYVDYFSAMVDDKGMLKRDLSEDGLHPNDAGYKIMAPIAEKAIQEELNHTSANKIPR